VGCTVNDFVLLSIVKVGSMPKAFVLFLLLSGRQWTSSDLLVAKDSPRRMEERKNLCRLKDAINLNSLVPLPSPRNTRNENKPK
jgi:hypothetical protein